MIRKIIRIDEEKCDGCGLCVPSCAEGALRIVNGKAKLVKEAYCDGLGNCLGTAPGVRSPWRRGRLIPSTRRRFRNTWRSRRPPVDARGWPQ